jgi:hypothetical protein
MKPFQVFQRGVGNDIDEQPVEGLRTLLPAKKEREGVK